MNLQQLKHVTALAEHKNFHRAASAVGLSQPALTQSIRNLEEELEVVLFVRSKREVTPTAYGLAVIHSAKAMTVGLSNLKREVELMKNLQSGRLNIGCDPWIARALLAPALSRILEVHPKLRFSVRSGMIDHLGDELLNGSIDIFVGVAPEHRDERLAWYDIELPPIQMMCNSSHPVLAIKEPTLKDCLPYPMAIPIVPAWFAAFIRDRTGNPRTDDGHDMYSSSLESEDPGLYRHLVKTTNTITSIFPSIVADELSRGELKILPLKEFDFRVPAVICQMGDKPISPAGELLMSELIAETETLLKYSV